MMHRCSCPHCGGVVRYGHGDPLQEIGSPLQECKLCHKKYLDSNMYEWALLPWHLKVHLTLFANCKWGIHMMMFAFSYGLTDTVWCILLFVIFELLLCGFLVFLMFYFNEPAIKKSQERSKDLSYIYSLVQSDYNKLRPDIYDLFQTP